MLSLDTARYTGKDALSAEAFSKCLSHGAITGEVMPHEPSKRPPSALPGPPARPPTRLPSYTYHDQHVPRHHWQATSSGRPSYEESKYHQRPGENGAYGGRGKKGGWVETPKSAYSGCEPAPKPNPYAPRLPDNTTLRFIVSHDMGSHGDIDQPINASTTECPSARWARARPQLVRQRWEESTRQKTA